MSTYLYLGLIRNIDTENAMLFTSVSRASILVGVDGGAGGWMNTREQLPMLVDVLWRRLKAVIVISDPMAPLHVVLTTQNDVADS